jgi:membrane-bound serine protease (ClpP class)
MFNQLFIPFLFILHLSLYSQTVVHVPIQGTIDMGLPNYIQRAITIAEADSAEFIIFDIDTFGGRVDAATKIKDAILGSNISTIAFINRRAISAGALISLSCDSIYMTSGATIGAATAVDAEGEKASEKVISYMREEMAASAEANGRSREIAEAMVDEEIKIDFILSVENDTLTSGDIEGFNKGKLITLSTNFALKLGIADNQVESFLLLLDKLKIDENNVVEVKETWSELLVRFLTNPTFAPILMSLGMIGLFFEIKSPGFGIPGGLGLLCLVLFFGSHLLVGLADSTEMLILCGGLLMVLLEILVIPGFGIAGIAGFLMIVYSLFTMLIGDYPLPEDLDMAIRSMSYSFVLMLTLGTLIFRALTRSDYYKRLIPVEGQRSAKGYSISRGYEQLIGKTGKCVTVLRPSGRVEINEKVYQAMSMGEFIEVGEMVLVSDTNENQIVVKRV